MIEDNEYNAVLIGTRTLLPLIPPVSYSPYLPNLVNDFTDPSSIQDGSIPAEIQMVNGVYYAGKLSFSDTTNGFRFGIDTDGTAKFFFGGASNSILWDG